jgi:hypothetical protein
MASTEVLPGRPLPSPTIRSGDPISVRWRNIRSIASGNSWSRPVDAQVLWFRRSPSFWMLGFMSPHTNDEQTVLSPRSCLQPASFFTGYTRSQQEQAVHRVRLGKADDDTLRRSSMTLMQLAVHDYAIRNSILTQTTDVWLTTGELMDVLGMPRRDIERETDDLIRQGLLSMRTRAVSGRGRPSTEFGRIQRTEAETIDG